MTHVMQAGNKQTGKTVAAPVMRLQLLLLLLMLLLLLLMLLLLLLLLLYTEQQLQVKFDPKSPMLQITVLENKGCICFGH